LGCARQRSEAADGLAGYGRPLLRAIPPPGPILPREIGNLAYIAVPLLPQNRPVNSERWYEFAGCRGGAYAARAEGGIAPRRLWSQGKSFWQEGRPHCQQGNRLSQRGNPISQEPESFWENGNSFGKDEKSLRQEPNPFWQRPQSLWEEGNFCGEAGNVFGEEGNVFGEEGNVFGEEGNVFGEEGKSFSPTGIPGRQGDFHWSKSLRESRVCKRQPASSTPEQKETPSFPPCHVPPGRIFHPA